MQSSNLTAAVPAPPRRRRTWRSEAGQGSLEYIIIIGIVVVMLVGGVFIFRKQVSNVMTKATTTISGWVKGDKAAKSTVAAANAAAVNGGASSEEEDARTTPEGNLSSGKKIPAWAWIVIAVFALGLMALVAKQVAG